MASNPPANANVPQIAQPMADAMNLAYVTRTMKQGIDSLAGFRGRPTGRAVTFDDLLTLGVLTQADIDAFGLRSVLAAAGIPYSISGYVEPLLTNSEVIFAQQLPQKVTFPANFGAFSPSISSTFGSYANSTGAKAFSIDRCPAASDPTVGGNWTMVGTASFGAGGHSAVLTTPAGAPAVFARGDYARITAPAVADGTLAKVHWALVGTR